MKKTRKDRRGNPLHTVIHHPIQDTNVSVRDERSDPPRPAHARNNISKVTATQQDAALEISNRTAPLPHPHPFSKAISTFDNPLVVQVSSFNDMTSFRQDHHGRRELTKHPRGRIKTGSSLGSRSSHSQMDSSIAGSNPPDPSFLRRTQSSSSVSSLNKQNQLAFVKDAESKIPRVRTLDSSKVIDPRMRAVLNLEPDLDPRLLRINPHSSAIRPGIQRGVGPISRSIITHRTVSSLPIDSSSVVLCQPAANTSKLVKRQLETTKCDEFDPASAMSHIILHDNEAVKMIQNNVTLKAINVGSNTRLYDDDSDKENETHNEMAGIPRAKKSLNKAWLESLEQKPDLEAFRPKHLQVDTISLPYPQLTQDVPLPYNGVPYISSYEVNFEDSRRLIYLNRKVSPDELFS